MAGNSIGNFNSYNGSFYNGTGSTILRGTRVKWTNTITNGCLGIAAAGLDDPGAGYCLVDIPTGQAGDVKFENAPGSQTAIADSGGVTAGSAIYGSASGLVGNTATSAIYLGWAPLAASAGNLFNFFVGPKPT